MCNLYSQTKGQAAIIALTRALRDTTGNLPPLPGIFPDTRAPVVANRGGIRELCMMRWGMNAGKARGIKGVPSVGRPCPFSRRRSRGLQEIAAARRR